VADWIVEFTPRAEKAVKRLDRSVRKRVFDKLREIQGADDPRDFLKSMTGPLTGMFRLRVGDYQVIVDIQDEAQRPTHGLDPLAQSPQSLTGAGARRPAGSRPPPAPTERTTRPPSRPPSPERSSNRSRTPMRRAYGA